MRILVPLFMACISLLATTAFAGAAPAARPAVNPATCAAFLVKGQGAVLWNCEFTDADGSQSQTCFKAFLGGDSGEQFDLEGPGALNLACDCNPIGRGKTLKFQTSRSSFLCLGGDAGGPFAVSGKVLAKGKEIIGI